MPTLHNQVSLIGRAGHAVHLTALTDGTPLARLRLYHRDTQTRAPDAPTQTYQLLAFDRIAANLQREVGSGDRLLIQGKLVSRKIEGADGRRETRTEIHVHFFTLLERRRAPRPICLNEPAPAGITKRDA